MDDPWQTAGTWFLGVTFIVLGVAGLVLPILQGILFLLVGFAILSRVSDRAQAVLDWAKEKAPDEAVEQAEDAKDKWLAKIEGDEP